MEMMPYQPPDDRAGELRLVAPRGTDTPEVSPRPVSGAAAGRAVLPTSGPAADADVDWREGLPTLCGPRLTLRELQVADAPALFAHLTTEEVARFISPPPTSVAGFERFIRWAHAERAAGRYACFAVVPAGAMDAVGMFQVRFLDEAAGTAEWGFALGSAHWGSGLFLAGSRLVVDFAVTVLGVRRLEARAALPNGRGNGALRKVGAVREAVLDQTFERHGERLDQALWVIAAADWWARRPDWTGTVH